MDDFDKVLQNAANRSIEKSLDIDISTEVISRIKRNSSVRSFLIAVLVGCGILVTANSGLFLDIVGIEKIAFQFGSSAGDSSSLTFTLLLFLFCASPLLDE